MTLTVRYQSLTQPLTEVANVRDVLKMQQLFGMILKMLQNVRMIFSEITLTSTI